MLLKRSTFLGYNWQNKPESGMGCADIPFLRDINKIALSGYLIDFLHPSGCFRSRPLEGIAGIENQPSSVEVAKAQSIILANMGVPISEVHYKNYEDSLIANYMLYSGICFIQSEGKSGIQSYFITKQRDILRNIAYHIDPKDLDKVNTDYFADQYDTTIEELTEAKYRVITLKPTINGYKLGKGTIYSNSNSNLLFPNYVLQSYKSRILGLLQDKVVCITYLDGDKGVRLKTSLGKPVIAKWLNTPVHKLTPNLWRQVNNPLCTTEIRLPNLESDEGFAIINILKIRHIEILGSV